MWQELARKESLHRQDGDSQKAKGQRETEIFSTGGGNDRLMEKFAGAKWALADEVAEIKSDVRESSEVAND